MPAIVTPLDNQRAIIAFARRLADHINVGVQEYNALPIVAEQLRATGNQADAVIAEVATKIEQAMRQGHTKYAWAPHTAILGEHLVSLVSNVYEVGHGKLANALLAAADTLESDIRTGYSS
jgi:type II secretory pathway component PulF